MFVVFVFLTLYLQKKKMLGWDIFLTISFLKYTSGFLTDFFSLIMGGPGK